MKSLVCIAKSVLVYTQKIKSGLVAVAFLFFLCLHGGLANCQNCNKCNIPAFPSVTVYQTVQTGPGIGFGVEGGNWKKDAGKFSYFIGTSLVWYNANNNNSKTDASQHLNQTMINFYVKGQYRLANHLYAIAAPGIGNMSYFELQTGLRYIIPVTHLFGVGIEPAYAFHQRELIANLNLHFALK